MTERSACSRVSSMSKVGSVLSEVPRLPECDERIDARQSKTLNRVSAVDADMTNGNRPTLTDSTDCNEVEIVKIWMD